MVILTAGTHSLAWPQPSPNDLRLIALSQRGHGESPKPQTGYTIGDFADDALAIVNAMGLESFALVGHSMGSLVAQEIALRRPEAVSSMLLIGSTLSADTEDLRGAHGELSQLEDPVPEEVARGFQEDTCAGPVGGSMTMDCIVEETMKVPSRVWDQALAGTLDYRLSGGSPDVAAIKCPVTVAWGEEDQLFPRDMQDALVEALPNAKLVTFQDVGHGVHWERPAECAALLPTPN